MKALILAIGASLFLASMFAATPEEIARALESQPRSLVSAPADFFARIPRASASSAAWVTQQLSRATLNEKGVRDMQKIRDEMAESSPTDVLPINPDFDDSFHAGVARVIGAAIPLGLVGLPIFIFRKKRRYPTHIVPRKTSSSPQIETFLQGAPPILQKPEVRHALTLGLGENATIGEVRSAYLQKIGEYAPDKLAGLGGRLRQLAQEDSVRLTEAYEYFVKRLG